MAHGARRDQGVIARVRPYNDHELRNNGKTIIEVVDDKTLTFDPKKTVSFSFHNAAQKGRDMLKKRNGQLQFINRCEQGKQQKAHPLFAVGSNQLAIALLAVVSTCYAARLDNSYIPPGNAYTPPHKVGLGGGGGGFRGTGQGNIFGSGGTYQSHGGGGGHGQDIPIVSYSSDNIGDGNYQFSYETGNGISVQEAGHQQGKTESVSGSFSYTGPDGAQYSISYTADENGFHPQGAHLPTPPPIPPEIQRGVELALAAEARGENQDGAYRGKI
ncbi:hypothetical protein DMN91_006092 [Ooceraea biroi]|uniref:Endocuticle structural glycoprotein SgAbd-2 n=1 Tax=Ooceraea biroi TaxID=2015173 RepID=A0A3L8DN61_OOCBI|nr:hypothetical protein DMN91_006092 [Ooceraea biroi]